MSQKLNKFSELEIDALREMMNIGFGKAAESLSQVINLHVILKIPEISVMSLQESFQVLRNEVKSPTDFNIVEQFFMGKFNGISFFLLPESEGKKLVDLFASDFANHGLSNQKLERETVMEIGNIIIGACVGKIAEILGDRVSYGPPRYVEGQFGDSFTDQETKQNEPLIALIFKTLFSFEANYVSGYLFLISNEQSIDWIHESTKVYLSKLL